VTSDSPVDEPSIVAVTGAGGTIGAVVRERLAERYSLRLLTRRPVPFASIEVDLGDLAGLARAFEGVDVVIHLAAASTVDSSWSDVLASNIVGTRNVFEAAVLAGVRRVVFASSNHVVGEYEVLEAPGIYDGPPRDLLTDETPIRADSPYGASKAFGEVLGRYYVDHHGLSVICLRMGTVRADDDPTSAGIATTASWMDLSTEDRFARMRATWLSHRDLAGLIAAAIETPERWAVAYGVSANPHRFWSLTSARDLLGFEPADSAPESDPATVTPRGSDG
jgi:nucleoside-diphosphate-sugar epimerase